jgi:ParB-like chromosome segregation protein Spo0J
MAPKKAQKTKQIVYQYIDPLMIKLAPRFQKAFDIDKTTKENIINSILEYGWDKDQPVILWKETGILIDGHTRRESAIYCGLARITYIEKSFENEKDAFAYIQGLQFNRRNLTDKDKLQILILAQDEIGLAKNKKQHIAKLLHCSERSAAKYMKVLKDP